MLTQLRLKNFKAWAEDLWDRPLRLAPITLLLGANSSGKTSLIQSLLLLKQTFSSPDRQIHLNLGGQRSDLLDLGSYRDVAHGHDAEREIGFGFATHEGLRYACTFRAVSEVPTTDRLEVQSDGEVYAAQRQSKGGYLLFAPGYAPRTIGDRLDAKRNFSPERSISLPPEAIVELGAAGSAVQDISLKLTRQLGRVAYLGPLREPPARAYLWSGQTPGSLGDRGQFAAIALLSSANSRKKRALDEEETRGWLVERTSEWLKRVGIADSLEMVRQGRSRFFEVIVKTGGQEANIVDVGFGVSQVLPLVVLAFFVPEGTTIVAEQPEIHLHPLVQAGLADLMADVSRTRKVQFIVETHSEHLFRRMQFLVADEKLAKEECALYFVEQQSKRAVLQELEIDPYGRVRNWPDRFFGDAMGETERQMEAMFARMARGSGDGQ